MTDQLTTERLREIAGDPILLHYAKSDERLAMAAEILNLRRAVEAYRIDNDDLRQDRTVEQERCESLAAEAERLRAELAAVKRQREQWAKWIARQTNPRDGACAQCFNDAKPGFVCTFHEARALAASQPAQQPKPEVQP